MPKHKCGKCGGEIDSLRHHYIYDRDSQKVIEICDDCMNGIEAESDSSHVRIFEPFWHPNLTTKPVWVKSKKHLKELDRKYNMTSYY